MAQSFRDSLIFTPFDLNREREFYLQCYADAWRCAHGSLTGFEGEALYRAALWRSRAQPGSLLRASRGGQTVGLLAVDEQRQSGEGALWVSFCYVVPEQRRQGQGRALLDYAAALARSLGRARLRQCVAPENPATEFYDALGFTVCGHTPGATEELLLLEKRL